MQQVCAIQRSARPGAAWGCTSVGGRPRCGCLALRERRIVPSYAHGGDARGGAGPQVKTVTADFDSGLIFEQDPVQIIDALLPLYLNATLLRALQVGLRGRSAPCRALALISDTCDPANARASSAIAGTALAQHVRATDTVPSIPCTRHSVGSSR